MITSVSTLDSSEIGLKNSKEYSLKCVSHRLPVKVDFLEPMKQQRKGILKSKPEALKL